MSPLLGSRRTFPSTPPTSYLPTTTSTITPNLGVSYHKSNHPIHGRPKGPSTKYFPTTTPKRIFLKLRLEVSVLRIRYQGWLWTVALRALPPPPLQSFLFHLLLKRWWWQLRRGRKLSSRHQYS